MNSSCVSSAFKVTYGGVLASLIFGLIAERFGISTTWIISGAMLIVSSALFIFMPEKQLRAI